MMRGKKTQNMTRSVGMVFLIVAMTAGGIVPSTPAIEAGTLPSAQANIAFELGMASVKEAKWDVAEKHFLEARALAPTDPVVLLNLGVANAKMGRALPATLWLRAYLAADPGAKNAEQVKKEITRLDDQAQEISRKLIEQGIASVELLPEDADRVKARSFAEIAFTLSATGRIDEAIKLSRRYSFLTVPESSFWCYFGQYQVVAGDFEGAFATLAKITETRERDRLLYWLSLEYIKWGKYREARETLLQITDPLFKTSAVERLLLPYIATLQLDRATALAKMLGSPEQRPTALSMLCMGYMQSGEMKKAEETAREIQNLKGPKGSYDVRDEALALAVTGHADDAYDKIKKAFKKIGKEENNTPRERVKVETALYFVSVALAWKGDTEWAEKICRLADKSPLEDGPGVKAARSVIAAEKKDFSTAIREVETLPADEKDRMCPLLVWRLIAKGQFDDAAYVAAEWPTKRGKAKGFLALAEYFGRVWDFSRWAYFLRKSFTEAATSNAMDVLNKIIANAKKCGNSAFANAILARARVTSWASLALYYESQPPVKDLPAYLREIKENKPELAAVRLAQAGEAWGSGLVTIKSVEERMRGGGL